jgi:transcriptional regulator with XRE-family HTH domain
MTFQELITSKGITQTQLAKAMGCGKNSVNAWCTGKTFPNPPSVDKIVEGFAVLGIKVERVQVFQSLLYTKRATKTWD